MFIPGSVQVRYPYSHVVPFCDGSRAVAGAPKHGGRLAFLELCGCRPASAVRSQSWHSSRPLVPGIGVPQIEQLALAVLLDACSRGGVCGGGSGGGESGSGDLPAADPAGDSAAGLSGSSSEAATACGRLRDSRSSSVSSVAKTSAGILPDARPTFGAHPNIAS